jgi:Glycosyltransferase family 28 C-terminal domain
MAENVIILGVTPTTSLIFDEEFPQLTKLYIEPYAISYSKILPLALKLVLDAPRILRVINRENKQLEKWIGEYKIDVVISDNRFGLYNSRVECIYITHQLNIQAGWLSAIANRIHRRYIKQFNAVWVPDFEDKKLSLAGSLSHFKNLKHVKYIGPLSRLIPISTLKEEFDYLFLLSGPEPHRSLFETEIIKRINVSKANCILVRGTNQRSIEPYPENLKVYDVVNANQLGQLITNAQTVICRSGYSTLMDLYTLNKKSVVLVPTPGQVEQEYLANYWYQNYQAKVVLQSQLKNLVLD